MNKNNNCSFMKKKVLIVFPILHHKQLVEGLCNSLNENDLEADALYWDSVNMSFFSISELKKSFSYWIYNVLFLIFRRVPGAWRIGIGGYLKEKCYCKLIENYDIILLAGVYDEDRLGLAQIAQKKGKKIVISLWGSDFYFINDFVNDWRIRLFELSDLIICGSMTMKKSFVEVFPQYLNKTKAQSYGLSQLETLKELMNGTKKNDITFLDESAKCKIVITIGYSGRPWQQHFYALDAIERLPQAMKENLFLLIPMTYDREGHYYSYLKYRLDEMGIPYQILKDRLPLIQNLSMRMVSDISVVIQKTDAMAASVQEHLMAGSLLIAGDWLPYDELFEYGIYFRKTSFEELYDNIKEAVYNIEEEKIKCSNNSDTMYSLRSWKTVGPIFAQYIQKLFINHGECG